ncbi:MAG: hypothetical protein AAB554_05630 [Patescibacteria group bacterium]
MPLRDLTRDERKILRALDAPWKIQDFLNATPTNHEPDGDTCLSPRRVLRERRAHCMEGAMLAALALRFHGEPPLVVDMMGAPDDCAHVVAVFKRRGHWGAISKTNHSVLRYREPIYRTMRELMMSYFHEYSSQATGKKTLRSYSAPVDLSRFDKLGWMTSEDDVWEIPEYLADVRHAPLITRAQIASLRKADPMELRVGEILEWPRTEA